MVKLEKYDQPHLVYDFTIPKKEIRNKKESTS